MNRGLLGLVLLLTLLLLIQRLVVPFHGTNPSGSNLASEQGRYEFRILGTNQGRLLLKIETTSGVIWKRGLDVEGPWYRLNDEVIVAERSSADAPTQRKRGARRPRRMDRGALKNLVAEIGRLQGIDVANLPEDLSLLTQIVRTGNPPELRGWAINQIAFYPPEDAVPAFVGLLDHTDSALLIRVVGALKKENDPVAIEPLRRLLESNPKPKISRAATAAIASLEAEAAKLVN